LIFEFALATFGIKKLHHKNLRCKFKAICIPHKFAPSLLENRKNHNLKNTANKILLQINADRMSASMRLAIIV